MMIKLNEENRERYTTIIINALHVSDKHGFRNHYLELHPSDQVDIFILSISKLVLRNCRMNILPQC